MAFAYTRDGESVIGGGLRMVWGTWTNGGGDTGGDIKTGLSEVITGFLTPSTAVSADASAINETLPLASGTVTIVNTAGADGYWVFIGR
jgi:hypothetical protein